MFQLASQHKRCQCLLYIIPHDSLPEMILPSVSYGQFVNRSDGISMFDEFIVE